MRVLITGGAGFIGGCAAVGLAERHPEWEIVALDNLRRRGSELNLPRLRAAGIEFSHGDVRSLDDLLAVGNVDALVECSAEPSILAGVGESPDYAVKSNLLGAYHCLELARRSQAQVVFLSTSRVYPVALLSELALAETDTRYELVDSQPVPGASPDGIAEDFPLGGARTLYGATKLAAELLIEEYRSAYGLSAAVNRCGVIAGPWQMGKVDQGVFTYWMLAHHFGRELRYLGYGGAGKQVRDLLHVDDLVELVERQLADPAGWDGFVGNVGGGRACSLSLVETTELCASITGRRVAVVADATPRPGDVPVYLSDCRRLLARTDWRARHGPAEILGDIHAWVSEHEDTLRRTLK
ncbi:MAG: NAD-dependent epimerase/dehydratase family protein [Solirubrobacteraceae bacterium]|jgi:CDP-paratose 2-epimerase